MHFMEKPANKRIDWIDCAKGIAILLVIFAHSIHYESTQIIIRGIIFSFHMPLFFILYGLTFRFSDDSLSFRYNLKKRFRHLIIPALICFVIMTLVDLLYELDSLNVSTFIKDHVTALLFSPGAAFDIGGLHIGSISMLWFMFVLFYASVIIDFLHLHLPKQIFVLFCSILFVLGYLVIFFGFGLPFALETVFLIIPFLLFGRFLLSKVNVADIRILIISFVLWIGSFIAIVFVSGTYLEIAGRRYPFFPVCHIAAIAGTVFVCCICGYFAKLGRAVKPFVVLGRYTLYVFIAHTFDYLLFFIWDLTDNNYLIGLIRIVMDLMIAFIIYKSRQLLSSALKRSKTVSE